MLGELLGHGNKDRAEKTDVNRGIVMALNGWCTIHPVVTKVRNWGWDGSGLNLVGAAQKQGQYLDGDSHFEYRSENVIFDTGNNRLMDANNEWNRERARWYNDPLTYLLYWILGKKNFQKWIRGDR